MNDRQKTEREFIQSIERGEWREIEDVASLDYVEMPEAMLARANPIQRQLLGAVSDPLSYYLPDDTDVPIKALVERNGTL